MRRYLVICRHGLRLDYSISEGIPYSEKFEKLLRRRYWNTALNEFDNSALFEHIEQVWAVIKTLDHIASSPFLRCIQTASLYSRMFGLNKGDFSLHYGLAEESHALGGKFWAGGSYDKSMWRESNGRQWSPDDSLALVNTDWVGTPVQGTPPFRRENSDDVRMRAGAAVELLLGSTTGNVMVVTHAGVAQRLLEYLTNRRGHERHLDMGEAYVLGQEQPGERWHLVKHILRSVPVP